MMDACTGRICSLQRVGSFCGQNGLCGSGTRFMNGPLGASCGGDNGGSLLLTITDFTYPAANAVNDGARRGLRLMKDNSIKSKDYSVQTVSRVAKFATRLWRTINGELASPPLEDSSAEPVGVCAHNNHLRCTLVGLYQWIWPRTCWQVVRAQSLMVRLYLCESDGLTQIFWSSKRCSSNQFLPQWDFTNTFSPRTFI